MRGGEAAPEGGPGGPTLQDRLLGIVGGAMILAALVFLVIGALEPGQPAASEPPKLELLEPSAGEIVTSPLILVFTAGSSLRPQAGGWGTEGWHVHAELDGQEVMPGRADISPRGGEVYAWTIGRVGTGMMRVRLFWSDESHRRTEAGATPEVLIELR